jgi:hypothetical protein
MMSGSSGTESRRSCLPILATAILGLFLFLAIMWGLLTGRVFYNDSATGDPFADDGTITPTAAAPSPTGSDASAEDGLQAVPGLADGTTPASQEPASAASCPGDLRLEVSEVGTSYDVGAPTMRVSFSGGSSDDAELTVSGPDALMDLVEVGISADPAASDARLVVFERIDEEPLETGVYPLVFHASSGDDDCAQPFDLEIVHYPGTQ